MPNLSVREASQADLDAAEGLLAAKDALASCATALKYAEAALREAEGDVKEALARVLAGEAERALAAVDRAKDELDGARAVLSFLSRSPEPGSPLQHRIFFALPSTPPGVREVDLSAHPALVPWRAAREALMRDADAAPPK